MSSSRELWERLPLLSRLIHPPFIFDYLSPDDREDGFLVLSRSCGSEAAEGRLFGKGAIDAYGQFKGDPSFGKDPRCGRIVCLRDPNAFDNNHGDPFSPIVDDLGMATVAEGKAVWGDRYLVLPDGRHGPCKFRTRAEKIQYLHLTGHREKKSFTH